MIDEMRDKIVGLTKIWYEIVSLDHHKDRDCHWYITEEFSYGNVPVFSVEHYGYCYDEVIQEFKRYGEAVKFLLQTIKSAIRAEQIWALDVIEMPKGWDKVDITRAKKTIKLIEKMKEVVENE